MIQGIMAQRENGKVSTNSPPDKLAVRMVGMCVIQLKGVNSKGALFTEIRLLLVGTSGRDLALSSFLGHLFFWFLQFLLCSFSIKNLLSPRYRSGYFPVIQFQCSVLLISWYLLMHSTLYVLLPVSFLSF